MKALQIERSVPRFAAAKATSLLGGTGLVLGFGPLRMVEVESNPVHRAGWHRLRPLLSGICGSDLATIDGASSRYFESLVSFPFVLGHEVVAEVADGELAGRRVVLEPALGCRARGVTPVCAACARGNIGRCSNLTFGHLRVGLQTGYCADTGGGWAEELWAHESQLHLVPDGMADEQAVMVEPTACAIHACLRGQVSPSDRVAVVGSGTLGLLTIAALQAYSPPAALIAVARYAVQRDLAAALGATEVVTGDELTRAVRRLSRSLGVTGRSGDLRRVTGGADVVFDCVGSPSSIAQSLDVVRPGGRIVLVGMPGPARLDLAPLWQREVSLVGAYAYGVEVHDGEERPTFDLAFELVAAANLERLVSAHYPLDHYDDAIRHAGTAGRRGAVKIVFDQRRANPRRRNAADDESETAET